MKRGLGLAAGVCVLMAAAASLRNEAASERLQEPVASRPPQVIASPVSSAAALPADAKVRLGTWSFVGPSNVAGPAPSITVDPHTGALYTVSREGWIYKSTDGAGTWQPVRRFDTPYKVAKLEIQRDATAIRAFLAITEPTTQSNGRRLLRMTPDGETLTQAPTNLEDMKAVGGLIYAVGAGGIWMSSDNGIYWQNLLTGNGGSTLSCSHMDAIAGRIFVSCTKSSDGLDHREIYRSVGGGQFIKVWAVPDSYTVAEGRIAISRSNPDVIYAAYRQSDGAYVFRTIDGGASWTLRADPTDGARPFHASLLYDFEAHCAGGQGPYKRSFVLTVDPSNADVVWIGSLELYRSNDAGLNFGRASLDDNKGAQAYHLPHNVSSIAFASAYNGSTNRNMYLGTSRGVYGTADARAAVQSTQTTCESPSALPAMKWMARTQGLNTTSIEAAEVAATGEVLATLGSGGEGWLFYGDLDSPDSWGRISNDRPKRLLIDPVLGMDRFFTSWCSGTSLCRWDWDSSVQRWNVTAKKVDLLQQDNKLMIRDPHNRLRYWSADPMRISRSENAMGTWTSAGQPDAPTPLVAGAVSPADPNVVLLADEWGGLYRHSTALGSDGNSIWYRSHIGPRGINDIQFDPGRPQRVFVTSYAEGMLVSIDGGVNWNSANHAGDGLPSGPGLNSLVVHRDNGDVLLLGMAQGLYVTWNYALGGQAWFEVPTPFADAAIRKLVLRRHDDGTNVLYAFTEGRGIWAAPITVQRFDDVPMNYWAFDSIDRLARAGVTGGCATSPLRYCPGKQVLREEMAVFLLRAKYGKAYQPPTASGDFSDVPVNYWAAAWIEQLREEGITGGCATNPLKYCPTKSVLREEIAVFLLRAKHGAGYQPPPATGMYADVPTSYWAAAWIEQLSREGIGGGCSTTPKNYCPTTPVTRDQMAVFLVRAFGL